MPIQQIARVAIRVSEQGTRSNDDFHSPELQMEEGRRVCRDNNFYLDEAASFKYQDIDVSGFRRPWKTRPGMARHFEDAKRGDFNQLIFYKMSRVARNTREGLDLIDNFEKIGVTIHLGKDQVDTSTPMGKFLRTMLLSVAEMQSEDTAAFVRDAVIARAKQGKLQGGVLPQWLQYNEQKDIGTSPQAVAAMRRMVELRMDGCSYKNIARKLNEEGYLTINGKAWTNSMTYKYLSESYIESMLGTGFLNRDLLPGHPDRIIIPNVFPAILTQEEGTAIQVVQRAYKNAPLPSATGLGNTWEANKKTHKRDGRYSAESRYLLAGRIYCGYCASRLQSSPRGDGRVLDWGYRCNTAWEQPRLHPTGAACCVSGWSLEDAVLRVIRKALVLPPAPVKKSSKQPKKPVERTVEVVSKEIDALLKLHLSEFIGLQDFQRQYGELVKERETLQSVDTEETAPDARAEALKLNEAGDKITPAQLRQLVLLMVERVEVPVYIEGRYVREKDKTNLRRYVRVTLKGETGEGARVYLSAVYTSRFKGAKEPPFFQVQA